MTISPKLNPVGVGESGKQLGNLHVVTKRIKGRTHAGRIQEECLKEHLFKKVYVGRVSMTKTHHRFAIAVNDCWAS